MSARGKPFVNGLKDKNQKCTYNRNVEGNKQQYLQQVHTHPIAYLTQILPQVAQYVPWNGAYAVQSQGYQQGQYICSEVKQLVRNAFGYHHA